MRGWVGRCGSPTCGVIDKPLFQSSIDSRLPAGASRAELSGHPLRQTEVDGLLGRQRFWPTASDGFPVLMGNGAIKPGVVEFRDFGQIVRARAMSRESAP